MDCAQLLFPPPIGTQDARYLVRQLAVSLQAASADCVTEFYSAQQATVNFWDFAYESNLILKVADAF